MYVNSYSTEYLNDPEPKKNWITQAWSDSEKVKNSPELDLVRKKFLEKFKMLF